MSINVLDQASKIPTLAELPRIHHKANMLKHIDRYISSFEEILEFTLSVRQLCLDETRAAMSSSVKRDAAMNSLPVYLCRRMEAYASHEARRASSKLQRQRKLCDTYGRQYENTVQTVRNEILR